MTASLIRPIGPDRPIHLTAEPGDPKTICGARTDSDAALPFMGRKHAHSIEARTPVDHRCPTCWAGITAGPRVELEGQQSLW